MEKICALLPMKGHSERVPNKNIRLFNGSPLFTHVLKTLNDTSFIDQIIINTDSEKIADLATKNSKKVHINWRPEDIQGDFVSMNDIINYDIENSNHEHFIQTHSTNPLLKVSTIDAAIHSYFEGLKTHDSIFSVTKLQTRLYWQNGEAINHNPDELLRTQDLPPVFEENSNFFIFSRQSFLNNNRKRIGKQAKMFEVNKLEAVDIDTEEDFVLAEFLQKLIK